MHVDEAHVHLHAYGLHPSGHADRLHPGKSAKASAVANAVSLGHDKKAANKIGDRAYVQAMRAWQDSYSGVVGLPHGLTRLGPGRRRLSRAEWKAEQVAARSIRDARANVAGETRPTDAVEKVGDGLSNEKQKSSHVSETNKRESITAEASTLPSLRDGDNILPHQSKKRLSRTLRICRVFATWVRTRLTQNAMQAEANARAEREARNARAALRRLQEEVSLRQQLEARLANAISAAHALGRQRDKLRREKERVLREQPVLGTRPRLPK